MTKNTEYTAIKVTVKPTETVEIFHAGKSLGEYKRVSQWEGMTKYENLSGQQIIVEGGASIAGIFGRIFGQEEEALLVKASPDILDLCCTSEKEPDNG